MIELWQNFYSWQNPIALDLGFLQLRWYGLMYVFALLSGYYLGRVLVKRGEYKLTLEQYDKAFIWVEIGVVVGARLGYVIFYDENTLWYLTHPWEIFNPFQNGEFVGISGLSYHGAIAGFVIGAWLFSKREKFSFLKLMDLSVIAGSAGYFFGRIGNFLNDRLVGRETDVPWGIYTHNALRHPSAIYEAILEGIVVAVILYLFRKKASFDGQLMAMYGMLYATARFIAEFYRRPDPQLGFIAFDWLTMGQLLSIAMFVVGGLLYLFLLKRAR